jgi:hypothetical protein
MRTLINFIAAGTLLAGIAMAQDFGSVQEHERTVIDRTQNDLRTAAEFERHHGKQTARYEEAQRHLSDFDRDLTKGHFDRGRLKDAIDDVKDVVDHNTLAPAARDALRSDLADLRDMREHDRR